MARIAGCKIKCVLVLMLSIIIFTSGCHKPMALNKNDTKLDLTNKSIALISVKVSNSHVPRFQPFLKSVGISKKDVKSKRPDYLFAIKDFYAAEKDAYNEYLISFALPAGKYLIFNVYGESEFKLPEFAQGGSWMPIYLPFELKPNEIAYLGRIDGTIRKRQNDNEMRAGPALPIIDQATAGYSNGTYDVIVSDNYEADLEHFIREYPVLKNYTVNKSLLPIGKQPTEGDWSTLLARWKQ